MRGLRALTGLHRMSALTGLHRTLLRTSRTSSRLAGPGFGRSFIQKLTVQVLYYRAKLASLTNLLNYGTDQDQHHSTPPFVFPDEFSLKCESIPFDSEPILLEASVEDALGHIEQEVRVRTTRTYRVPPLAIVSMARSGKATLLNHLYNQLLENGKFHPILVDFNGFSGFKRWDRESDYDAFVRWVATSLLFHYKEAVPTTVTCQVQDLEEYLSKSKKPVVLLVDELNALTGNNVSRPLAELLRVMFLDQPGWYLCFTSHWSLDIKDVVGHSPSPRGTHFVHVPRTQKEEEINGVLPPSIQLTPVQVAACLGSVGLLVSIYGGRTGGSGTFSPSVYFAEKMGSTTEYPVELFLDEFCSGRAKHKAMRCFDMFTTRVEQGKIEWPMCFAKEFLLNAGETELYHLIDHAENAVNLPQTETGYPTLVCVHVCACVNYYKWDVSSVSGCVCLRVCMCV